MDFFSWLVYVEVLKQLHEVNLATLVGVLHNLIHQEEAVGLTEAGMFVNDFLEEV